MPKKMYKYLASQVDAYFTDVKDAQKKFEEIVKESHKNKMAMLVLEELKNITKAKEKV